MKDVLEGPPKDPMLTSAQDAYLEMRVLSADPVELVCLLYQAACGAVRDARRHLANGEIAQRGRAVSKAFAILAELNASLDHGAGWQYSEKLAALYDYMQRRLLEANAEQEDVPLAEVAALLSTLHEGWQGAARTMRNHHEEQSGAELQAAWAGAVPNEEMHQSWTL